MGVLFCSVFFFSLFSSCFSPTADAAPQKSRQRQLRQSRKKNQQKQLRQRRSLQRRMFVKAVVAASNKSVRKTAGKTTTRSRKFAASKKVSKRDMPYAKLEVLLALSFMDSEDLPIRWDFKRLRFLLMTWTAMKSSTKKKCR